MHFHSKGYGRSGHPLIILHGLFGSLDNWATLAKVFARKFRVFTFDARNHGRSGHSDDMSFAHMADDLKAYMGQHRIHSSHLIGHSMGGKTVMQFALTYPEMTDRMIVVDVAPRSYSGRHDAILDALNSLTLHSYTSRGAADEALAGWIANKDTRQFLLKNLARRDGGGFRWKMNLPVLAKNYTAIADNITVGGTFSKPVLFLKGGRSSYIRDGDHSTIKELFPGANIATIKEAGHWVHSDAPESLTKFVFGFLSDG